jgi:superfamily II DNA or RNA helicase|tara:strand:- start:402 stop:1607 length:1206 start_codon:yes stop_codon:yes gene_type:complete
MTTEKSGQIIIPTGGGKTFIMIADCDRIVSQTEGNYKTFVIVAPRILLANQLSSEFESTVKNVKILHVHSGETHHFSTTNSHELSVYHNNTIGHKLIFTTYHSLHRVLDSDINIDRMYFDEAHNGTGKNFFQQIKRVAASGISRYFFTATPRVARSKNNVSAERGMNNAQVYGNVLEQTEAWELINSGTILPPKVIPFPTDRERTKQNAHEVDCDNLKDIINSIKCQAPKILVSAPTTRILWNMLTHTDIRSWLYSEQYNIMHITSKHGAIINGKKVGREEFFETLTKWGKDNNKKFIIFHYSILSEGINVPGLTHSVMLRNLPTIEMAQTIGRVIRVHNDDRKLMEEGKIPAGKYQLYTKSFGQICVPIAGKYGERIAKRLQSVVSYIFIEGIPPKSYVS